MSRLARYTQKIFGSTAGSNQMATFGSEAAGFPFTCDGATVTPTIVQGLSQYLSGWFSGVLGSFSPTIEDMNALFYLLSYQIAYLLQTGIPEWDSGTTYYVGDLVQDGSGQIYKSLTNSNLNNALTDATNWKVLLTDGIPVWNSSVTYSSGDIVQDGNGRIFFSKASSNLNHAITDGTWWFVYGGKQFTTSSNVTISSSSPYDVYVMNITSGNLTATLAAANTVSEGWRATIKCVGGSTTNYITVSSASNIDGNTTYVKNLYLWDSITLISDGIANWFVI